MLPCLLDCSALEMLRIDGGVVQDLMETALRGSGFEDWDAVEGFEQLLVQGRWSSLRCHGLEKCTKLGFADMPEAAYLGTTILTCSQLRV